MQKFRLIKFKLDKIYFDFKNMDFRSVSNSAVVMRLGDFETVDGGGNKTEPITYKKKWRVQQLFVILTDCTRMILMLVDFNKYHVRQILSVMDLLKPLPL